MKGKVFFLTLLVWSSISTFCKATKLSAAEAAAASNQTCTYSDCKTCAKNDCDRSCAIVNGKKSCSCRCTYGCVNNRPCPDYPGKDPVCGRTYDNRCSIGFGGDCPATVQCNPKSGGVARSFFYISCQTDSDCATALGRCQNGDGSCVPTCITFSSGKDCVCLCKGEVK